MIFKDNYNGVIYCKDKYCKKYDNTSWENNNGIYYYKGYMIHQENKPAIEHNNGTKVWILNGRKHREDGPAIKHNNGYKEWYLNGIEYSEKEYLNIINLKKKSRVLDDI